MRITPGKKAVLVIIAILLVDQLIKIWVKTHMSLGESIHMLGSWGQLAFTENTGFAFGWSLGGDGGKLALSVFRIAAVALIGWYLHYLIKKKVPTGLLIGIAALLAGAAGNIIDCSFYGLIFDKGTIYSPELNATLGYAGVAEFSANGYSSFLHGSVVDMFYFPIIECQMPNWVPFWGGEDVVFFRPIFNFADASISVAIFYLLIFQRKHLAKLLK